MAVIAGDGGLARDAGAREEGMNERESIDSRCRNQWNAAGTWQWSSIKQDIFMWATPLRWLAGWMAG